MVGTPKKNVSEKVTCNLRSRVTHKIKLLMRKNQFSYLMISKVMVEKERLNAIKADPWSLKKSSN